MVVLPWKAMSPTSFIETVTPTLDRRNVPPSGDESPERTRLVMLPDGFWMQMALPKPTGVLVTKPAKARFPRLFRLALNPMPTNTPPLGSGVTLGTTTGLSDAVRCDQR